MTTNNAITWDSVRDEILSNPEVKAEYDNLIPEFQLARAIITLREKVGLTQREFAAKVGMKQSQLARIESGKQIPKLQTLAKLAAVAGYEVEVNLIASEKEKEYQIESLQEQKGNFDISYISNGEITGNVKIAGVINEAEQNNLADAAQEIQQLLEQLSKTYPTNTSKEKMIVVGEAVEKIEQNPSLKAKVINALKARGIEAFKAAINHSLVNILLTTIEGWQDEY